MLNPTHLNSQQQVTQSSFFSRPMILLLGTVWGALIIVAAVALVGLLSPGGKSPSEEVQEDTVQFVTPVQPNTEETPEPDSPLPVFTAPAEPVENPSNESIGLPLWMFGAIALSCAGGSLVVTYALKQALTPSSARPQGKRVVRKKKVRKKMVKRPVTSPRPISTHRPQTQRVVSQPRRSQPSPQVTILPPDLSHPLDEEKEELTDLFDLRKRRSLSSLMQDF